MIGDSLGDNLGIRVLDLSWNSFGSDKIEYLDDVGKRIGNGINNDILLHLDLSYNMMSEKACMDLGDCLKENHTLLGIHVTGNACEIDGMGFISKQLKKPADAYDEDLFISK